MGPGRAGYVSPIWLHDGTRWDPGTFPKYAMGPWAGTGNPGWEVCGYGTPRGIQVFVYVVRGTLSENEEPRGTGRGLPGGPNGKGVI